MSAEVFFDTNVLLYLLSADASKADRAEALVQEGGAISVQVLNELANVARRKLGMPWGEIAEVLETLRSLCTVRALDVETHVLGLRLAERHKLSVYDAMILAAAVQEGCHTLFSEDLHHGLLVEGRVRVRNPFRVSRSPAP
jgi:predicted nucleic acid-binding protein